MEFHRGRLLDHVHLRVNDLQRSKTFYRAALDAVGREITHESDEHGFFASDELFFSSDGPPTSGMHLAFQADDHETVVRFHEAAIAGGGRDNGAPGERPYHPGYFSAYVLDPDGNNIEAVHHGPSERSAASVVFTTPGP